MLAGSSQGDIPCTMDVLMPFSRSSGGGSVVSGALLARTLRDCGLKVHALFPSSGAGEKIFKKYGIPVTFSNVQEVRAIEGGRANWRSLPSVSAYARTLSFAIRFARTHKPRVLHVNDDTTVLPWGIAGRLLHIPVVWHVRKSRKGALDGARRRLVTSCISISDAVRERLEDVRQIETIYNPVDTDRFYPRREIEELRRRLRLESELTLLFVGRPVPYKRAPWALQALENVLDTGVDANLVILGGWSKADSETLLQSATQAARDAISFVDHTVEPELYFAAADILLHPAYEEAFGRVIAEAQASGVSPVGTNSGGAKEIIDHGRTGYLADPDSPEEFIHFVVMLARDPDLRARIGGEAAEQASSRFSMHSYRVAIQSYYQRSVLPFVKGAP